MSLLTRDHITQHPLGGPLKEHPTHCLLVQPGIIESSVHDGAKKAPKRQKSVGAGGFQYSNQGAIGLLTQGQELAEEETQFGAQGQGFAEETRFGAIGVLKQDHKAARGGTRFGAIGLLGRGHEFAREESESGTVGQDHEFAEEEFQFGAIGLLE